MNKEEQKAANRAITAAQDAAALIKKQEYDAARQCLREAITRVGLAESLSKQQ